MKKILPAVEKAGSIFLPDVEKTNQDIDKVVELCYTGTSSLGRYITLELIKQKNDFFLKKLMQLLVWRGIYFV